MSSDLIKKLTDGDDDVTNHPHLMSSAFQRQRGANHRALQRMIQ